MKEEEYYIIRKSDWVMSALGSKLLESAPKITVVKPSNIEWINRIFKSRDLTERNKNGKR